MKQVLGNLLMPLLILLVVAALIVVELVFPLHTKEK